MNESQNVEDLVQRLELRIQRESKNPNLASRAVVTVKPGPVAFKNATLEEYKDPTTGEIKSRSLRLRSYKRKKFGSGYDFEEPDQNWSCETEEIDRLRVLLDEIPSHAGRYRLVDANTEVGRILERLAGGQFPGTQIASILGAMSRSDQLSSVAHLDEAEIVASTIDRARKQSAFNELRKAAENPDTSEQQLQSLLQKSLWLFGGEFIGTAKRRDLTAFDQVDFPLMRPDRSLHIVEIKKAYVPKLVVPYRSHYIVGTEINEAASQTMNYLRRLDQKSDSIAQDFNLDVSRSSATVVIGHRNHCNVDDNDLSLALRTYNSHLSRVQVITYDDLIAGGEGTLGLNAI